MYYSSFIILFIVWAFSPIGAIANSVETIPYDNDLIGDARYDFAHSVEYLVEGHSMESYGFMDGTRVDVVPATTFQVGDVIAFECTFDKCNGAYVKKIIKKDGECYWVEGRKDVWEENGSRRQSMDSRTTYGWLCNNDISIYGVAFPQKG